jgi:hypothetical protein
MAAPKLRRNGAGRAAASASSRMTSSAIPSRSSAWAEISMLSAISAARVLVRYLSTEAPSGDSADSQLFSAAMTRSAGSRARAAPPAPWPMSTASVGDWSVIRSARHRAISAARPRSSASLDSSAPAVSMTVTSGSRSSAASRMPRRAIRSAAGPTGWPSSSVARSCPWASRFSASWTPAGNGRAVSDWKTRGPVKPMSAPGSATVRCPSDPQDAKRRQLWGHAGTQGRGARRSGAR